MKTSIVKEVDKMYENVYNKVGKNLEENQYVIELIEWFKTFQRYISDMSSEEKKEIKKAIRNYSKNFDKLSGWDKYSLLIPAPYKSHGAYVAGMVWAINDNVNLGVWHPYITQVDKKLSKKILAFFKLLDIGTMLKGMAYDVIFKSSIYDIIFDKVYEEIEYMIYEVVGIEMRYCYSDISASEWREYWNFIIEKQQDGCEHD